MSEENSTNIKNKSGLITTMQVARFLGYKTAKSIRELVNDGFLKPRYLPRSKRPRFLQSEVEALIKDKPYDE